MLSNITTVCAWLQAPSSSLAVSVLRLHSDDHRCGHVILQLVQQLSLRVKATISDIAVDHSLLVQLVVLSISRHVFTMISVPASP